MTLKQPSQERGAALLVALIMLLILTVLAVSSMRGVVLESRITGNRAESLRLQAAADAALREGEFRFTARPICATSWSLATATAKRATRYRPTEQTALAF